MWPTAVIFLPRSYRRRTGARFSHSPKTAKAAGTLLIDPGEAEPFRFDPVHDHPKPACPSKTAYSFSWVISAARVNISRRPIRFTRNSSARPRPGVVSSLCAWVSRILCSMAQKTFTARWSLSAWSPRPDHFPAHAYTDGGLVREYTVEPGDGCLEFADVPPGHGQWKRARKTLTPTEVGFRRTA